MANGATTPILTTACHRSRPSVFRHHRVSEIPPEEERAVSVDADAKDRGVAYKRLVQVARDVIQRGLDDSGELNRADIDRMLEEHDELGLDDLDIALTQLSSEGMLRRSTRGYVRTQPVKPIRVG
jgi:hypothetical protein